MFILTEIEDLVRIHPSNFSLDKLVAIEDELNKKYANRIVHDVGLAIRVFDISTTSDPIVHQCQDGGYQCKGTHSTRDCRY